MFNRIAERMLARPWHTAAGLALYLAASWGMYAAGGSHPVYTLPVMLIFHVFGVYVRLLLERR